MTESQDNSVDPFDKIRFMNRIAILESERSHFQTKEKHYQDQIKSLTANFKGLSDQLFNIVQPDLSDAQSFCGAVIDHLQVGLVENAEQVLKDKYVQSAILAALRIYGATKITKDNKK